MAFAKGSDNFQRLVEQNLDIASAVENYLIENPPGGVALGETSITAYRGDRGKIGFDHSQLSHAPDDAQPNNISDVNAGLLTGGQETALHSHAGSGGLTQSQILTRQL